MTAKVREPWPDSAARCSVENFWIVVMTIRAPPSSASFNWSRGAVDLPDHAPGLLELRGGILKLAVQHDAIGHDDGRTEDRTVGIVMQIGDLVCRPADGVGLAGARRMLDQVAMAGAVPASVRHQPAHGVELVFGAEI